MGEVLCVMDLQGSTCCPSASFSVQKSSYALSIVKMVFQSEFLPTKICNILGIVFSSALESVCVYSSMAA